MKTIPLTPLEPWIADKIGLAEGSRLRIDDLRRFQLERLNDTLGYVRERSPFYRELLSGTSPEPLASLRDIRSLPFTTMDDLRRHHARMLCVSQSDVARIVTLRTSGTTAEPKRLYFTDEDLELTADFFQHGMSTMVRPGWTVLILLPGTLPDSVGNLLMKGLARMFVKGIVHGPVTDPERALQDIERHRPDCLVGIPSQVMSLARLDSSRRDQATRTIKSILLSTDYVPRAVTEELSRVWGCEVFEHYGMTETGLGGGVECAAHDGYHLREADLYFEIVDPDDGQPLDNGESGEVVFSTLTRRGMPLVRYRTGDVARFLPDPCPCGSVLPRLDKVRGRLRDGISLPGGYLAMPELDEAVFTVSGVLDYRAEITTEQGRDRLHLTVSADPQAVGDVPADVKNAVERLCRAKGTSPDGLVAVELVSAGDHRLPTTTGTAKRSIVDRRG